MEFPYKTLEEFNEIFVYLCEYSGGIGGVFGGKKKSAKPIAYAKFKATDFADTSPSL